MDPINDFGFSDDEALKLFVGQTYSQVCMHDSMVVDGNRLKNDFRNIAENILIPQRPQQPQFQQQFQANIPNGNPYIDGNRAPIAPPPNDPDQMEFKFDNSQTAVAIEKKFDTIISRLNAIDKTLKSVLSYIDDSENSK